MIRNVIKTIKNNFGLNHINICFLQFIRNKKVGNINFGQLRRLTPISKNWGFDRGLPIDRFYIEKFISEYVDAVKGHVLEIGNDRYTKRFGGKKVTRCDILNVVADNPKTTIIADLSSAPHIPSGTFDCIIFTQTLQFIPNFEKAADTLYRILKSEGVLLATFPTISKIDTNKKNANNDYWRFTSVAVRWIFGNIFGTENISVKGYGNLLTAVSFLYGLTVEDLNFREIDYFDPQYELIVALKAIKK
jgi:SAM-dependent methyltransferase